MAITVLLDMNVQPGKSDDMITWMRTNLPESQQRPGAGKIEMIVDQEDPNHIIIYEVWDSRADQEAYLAWRTERGDLEVLGAMFASPPTFTFFDNAYPG